MEGLLTTRLTTNIRCGKLNAFPIKITEFTFTPPLLFLTACGFTKGTFKMFFLSAPQCADSRQLNPPFNRLWWRYRVSGWNRSRILHGRKESIVPSFGKTEPAHARTSGWILCWAWRDRRRNRERGSTWQRFGLNVKILNIERERQFPWAPAFSLQPNSARGPRGMLGWKWRGGDENSPQMRDMSWETSRGRARWVVAEGRLMGAGDGGVKTKTHITRRREKKGTPPLSKSVHCLVVSRKKITQCNREW